MSDVLWKAKDGKIIEITYQNLRMLTDEVQRGCLGGLSFTPYQKIRISSDGNAVYREGDNLFELSASAVFLACEFDRSFFAFEDSDILVVKNGDLVK